MSTSVPFTETRTDVLPCLTFLRSLPWYVGAPPGLPRPRCNLPWSRVCEEPSGQYDVDDIGHRIDAGPIPLQFAGQRHPADRVSPCLDNAFQTSPVRLRRGPTDRIYHREHLEPVAEGIQGRKGQTHLGPQCGHDQLRAAGRLDATAELDVFPGVDRRPVDLGAVRQNGPQLGDRRALTVCDVDRRQHDGQVEGAGQPGHGDDIVDQHLTVDRGDRLDLARWVVDSYQWRAGPGWEGGRG